MSFRFIVFIFVLFFYTKDLFYAILTEEHSHMGCCYVWLLYGLVSFSTIKLKFLSQQPCFEWINNLEMKGFMF